MAAQGEIITKERAAEIAEYRRKRHDYEYQKQTSSKIVIASAIGAITLWIISYLASSGTGPVNMGAWFSIFTAVTFGGACFLSICCMVAISTNFFANKPDRPGVEDS